MTVLDTVVKSWIMRVAQKKPCIFQQDSTRFYMTQEWLAEIFFNNVITNLWIPITWFELPEPGLGGVAEKETKQSSLNIKDSLKMTIVDMSSMNENHLIKACSHL